MISADTTLAKLLDEHPELIDTLSSHHAHFAQLRDVRVRRIMAGRLTVEQAAAMAGVATGELLAALRHAAGETGCAHADDNADHRTTVAAPATKPAHLTALPAAAVVELDVRDDVRRGHEPFARIMAAVKTLGTSQVLVLHAPFEPVPLYDVLGRRGFAHWSENPAPGHWVMWFYRDATLPGPPGQQPEAPGPRPLVVDVRGLAPPQPMRRVLAALDDLAPGQQLEIVHDRRPMLLYPLLAEQGCEHTTDESEPGVVRIRVSRTREAG